ncbi:XrtB/PEP-CTERM-associated transcriptional regulator EpsA [Candidatus Methylopumilus turicensis]|uniref:Transcriptional regulator, LuxR family n=1 Tax=Candidatus Methylopumilus turicensis TaxID=1581680 RepID=A0A0B7J0I8_9PROT|nr:XrtB/PEP-CTERM-associated transcriptional regulator EpsA [Candidatus Methylopumilus turicensis]CEN56282.1 Transcriptional regulator, LuxR family [Candidatus Methylopumilus turicensis]
MANVQPALTEEESVLLLDVFEESLRVYKREQFFSWLQGSLQSLIPHEVLICGVSLKSQSQLHFESFVSTRYVNDQHVRLVTGYEDGIVNRVIDAWKKDLRPILVSHTLDEVDHGPYRVPFVESEEVLKQLELRNIAAHGLSNKEGDVITFFSFSRIAGEPNPRHAYILQLLVPQMHHAFLRVMNDRRKSANKPVEIEQRSELIEKTFQTEKQLISPREIEVLRWVFKGKTNPEIGEILYVSINTVKNHVHNAISKLGVENRAQAATLAHKMNLLK